MRRFLVVGCGGSGGATIRYIQDQLLAEVLPEGTEKLPAGWQFVHVDVPTTPDSGPLPLGSVVDMGGRYVSVSEIGNTYRQTADQLFQKVSTRLDELLGWLPTPFGANACKVPVTEGAGQFRAVGRALTLTRSARIQKALDAAYADLNQPSVWAGLNADRRAKAEKGLAGDVVPIVIGSLAGGSGASMFLDVCRLLGRVGGINIAGLGAFLFTSDVFQTLPSAARLGVEGNALGAMGDLIAAQTGLAAEADREIFEALGLNGIRDEAFARIFPIGSAIGGDGARFGDGTPGGVFRGIGRALAALMLAGDNMQDQYVSHIVGNPNPPPTVTTSFGWGTQAETITWGSFGYASLSLGRDRYVEYAAQRIARSAADRLMTGHMDPMSQQSSSDQLNEIVDRQWPPMLDRLGLPQRQDTVRDWFQQTAVGEDVAKQEVRRILMSVTAMVSSVEQAPAKGWFEAVSSRLPMHTEEIRAAAKSAAYSWAEHWAQSLEQSVIAEFIDGTKLLGLPYGRETLTRLRAHVDWMIDELGRYLNPESVDPVKLESSVAQRVASLKKAVIGAGHELATEITKSLSGNTAQLLRAEDARLVVQVLTSFRVDVLDRLITSASHSLAELEAGGAGGGEDAGLAQLRTDAYEKWPTDGHEVPARFAHAENEVLLTVASEFPASFESHVVHTVPGALPYRDALSALVSEVISGKWQSQGGRSGDFEIVHVDATWRAPVFTVDSQTGAPTPRSAGSYTLNFRPAQLLERSRAFLARPGEPFSVYSTETIEHYLSDSRHGVTEVARRKDEFVRLFREAMALARPLVGADATVIQAVHPDQGGTKYSYNFSPLGLKADNGVVQAISETIDAAGSSMDDSVLAAFQSSAGDDTNVSRIAIFGSYPKYSPVVFNSLLGTVSERFSTVPSVGRADLWRWKGTRPLPASLPMSPAELRALIGGWHLGRLTGCVRTGSPHDPAAVFDDERGRWVAMPWPMLTSPSAVPDIDWLPIVLESYSLALVNCNKDPSLTALRPYVALRRLWDRGEALPTEPGSLSAREAERRIAEWIDQGVVAGADLSQVVGGASGMLAGERRAAALKWISSLRGLLQTEFLKEGSGLRYGKLLGRVDSPEAVFTSPRMVSIAPLVYDVLGELDSVVGSGKEENKVKW